ncbi:MAG: class I SAM-dependent methyltransferase [Fibromonadaceae bacterium]|nr:class I SAM-dependent methyltransferase [Fibromonadaceae bacterium]
MKKFFYSQTFIVTGLVFTIVWAIGINNIPLLVLSLITAFLFCKYRKCCKTTRDRSQKKQSHLYEEYALVSEVPSITKQWELQAEEIIKINPENMLALGIGFGDEIICLIERLKAKYINQSFLGKLKSIEWIDLDDKYAGKSLKTMDFSPVEVRRIEPNNLLDIVDKNRWDCILCSFVLHDIKYEDKEKAISILHKALKPEGVVIISEMFLDNKIKSGHTEELERKREIDVLYDGFYKEVQKEIGEKTIGKENFLNELLEIKEGARNGKRDYFIAKQQTIDLLSECGFVVNTDEDYIENKTNPCLGIIIGRKPI